MKCTPFAVVVDGKVVGHGHICGSRAPRRRCSVPGCTNWGIFECDYPVSRKGKAGTCDKLLCERCTTKVGEDEDICPPHVTLRLKGETPHG